MIASLRSSTYSHACVDATNPPTSTPNTSLMDKEPTLYANKVQCGTSASRGLVQLENIQMSLTRVLKQPRIDWTIYS
jgi:hypothetical protein